MSLNIPNRIWEQQTAALPSLAGKCFAITGTTSGTGYHACVAAIEKGVGCLLLLNRRSERSEAAAAKLQALCNGTVLRAIDCDLQSFDSVAKAASEVSIIAASYGGLDACINNAGVMADPDQRTGDGYDVQMQTNHLSHFLLTHLLMPSLEAAAASRGEARVVQHSSGARVKPQGGGLGMLEAQFMQPAAEGALGGNKMPACFGRYHQSKLANSVFAMALHERLSAKGSKVKSICAEPGTAATEGRTRLFQGIQAPVSQGIQSAADGACSLMEAAFGAGAESGDFYMPGEVVKKTVVGVPKKCITAGQPTPISEGNKRAFEEEKLTMDPANQQLLWAESERATEKWLQTAAGGLKSKL